MLSCDYYKHDNNIEFFYMLSSCVFYQHYINIGFLLDDVFLLAWYQCYYHVCFLNMISIFHFLNVRVIVNPRTWWHGVCVHCALTCVFQPRPTGLHCPADDLFPGCEAEPLSGLPRGFFSLTDRVAHLLQVTGHSYLCDPHQSLF